MIAQRIVVNPEAAYGWQKITFRSQLTELTATTLESNNNNNTHAHTYIHLLVTQKKNKIIIIISY